jgi:hypothetical protein
MKMECVKKLVNALGCSEKGMYRGRKTVVAFCTRAQEVENFILAHAEVLERVGAGTSRDRFPDDEDV